MQYYNLHETYRMPHDPPCDHDPTPMRHEGAPRRMWTIAEIKAELPNVPVQLPDGTECAGTLTGRKCPFPHVTVKAHGANLHLEAAWETVQHVLNWGSALLA